MWYHLVFNREALIGIINSLVFSKLFYCFSVWASTSSTDIEKMQCVQNFPARIVTATHKYDHITPCLKELKWLPVEKKLYLRDAIMAFKCNNGIAPGYLSGKFSRRGLPSGRITRQLNDIHVSKFRTAMSQKSFTYRGSVIWNCLSRELKLCASTKIFMYTVCYSKFCLFQLGVYLGAEAVSHLEEISEEGIEMMAASSTVGVVLPTTAYILKLKPPPVRKMIEHGRQMMIEPIYITYKYCYLYYES